MFRRGGEEEVPVALLQPPAVGSPPGDPGLGRGPGLAGEGHILAQGGDDPHRVGDEDRRRR